jgi:hypothetical protein
MATLSQGSAAACRFDYHDATASRELRITVDQGKDPSPGLAAYTTQCSGAAAPLRAIGNEAVACAVDTKGHTHGAEVIGRVRDQIFTVTVTTNMRNDPSMPREALEEKTRNIAEQVAGALF